jgi:Leucine-rich repeat (LRR) protein
MNCRSLTSVNLSQNITKYSDGLFTNCSALTALDVDSQVTSIGNDVFQLCTNLSEIHIHSGVTEIGTNVFLGVPEDMKIYGAEGSKAQSYATENSITFVAE